MLLLRRHLRSLFAIAPLALLILLGTRALAAYQVNENCLALALSMLMLHLLLREKADRKGLAIAAGVIFGHMVGIRPATLTLIPVVFLLARHRAWLGAAFVSATGPWLLTNALGLGALLRYPQLEVGRETQRLFVGTPFEWELTFHPLNWPLNEQLMTSPHHPFPTLVRLPLEVIQAYGAPLLGIALLGLAVLWWNQQRKLSLSLLLWMLPIPLFLMLITALDYQKQSYVLLAMAPLPLLIGAGLSALPLPRWVKANMAAMAVLFLVVAPIKMRNLRLPVDERQHVDHSPDARDNEPWKERRAELTRASFLPYLSQEISWDNLALSGSILSHASPAVSSREPGTPIPAGPVAIWVALSPDPSLLKAAGQKGPGSFALLPGPFRAETAKKPLIPPEFLGRDGLPGAGPTTGRLAFVVAFPKPAPRVVRAHLVPRGDGYVLNVSYAGELVQEKRYLTVLVTGRVHQMTQAPGIVLNTKFAPVHTTVMWNNISRQWKAEPRLVSNEAWSVQWKDGVFGLGKGEAQSIAGDTHAALECSSEKGRVYKVCPTDYCAWAYADSNGVPQAILVPDALAMRGARVFTWGEAYPMWPSIPAERCFTQWMKLLERQ
jgi:hypothetical protein